MKKYILTILLTIGIILPTAARDFTYTYEGQTLTYTVISETDKTCKTKEGSYTYYNYKYTPGNEISGDLVIPSVVSDGDNTFSVIELGVYGFCMCELGAVSIPNSVTSIGPACFIGCTGLTSISIPNSVTSLKEYCFSKCVGLTSISIPNSVTSLQDHCFSDCIGLTSISLPNSLTCIGDNCFSGCTGLSSLIIPETTTTIGRDAFMNCTLDPLILKCKIQGDVFYIYDYIFSSINKYSHIFCLPENYEFLASSAKCKVTSYPFNLSCKPLYCGAKFTVTPTKEISEEKYKKYFTFVKHTSYDLSCNGESFYTQNDGNIIKAGEYLIKGLRPSTSYTYDVKYQINNFKSESRWSFTTLNPTVNLYYESVTQSKIKDIWVYEQKDESITPEIKIKCQGQDYTYTGRLFDITNLTPDTEYRVYLYADYNGYTKYDYKDIKTSHFYKENKIESGPTTIELNVSVNPGDATITDMYWSYNGDKLEGNKPVLTGLDPNKEYSFDLNFVFSNGGSKKYTYSKKTAELQLEILDPKCTTSTSAILGALTNMSDAETNAGFQWKKYDAPESLKPSEAYTPVSDGMIEGIVKNLQPTSYYNVRAFYKSAAGTYYYSDWLTFDPSDFSYFEPTVRTYALTEVNGNSVTLHGYALQGSDDIISQGFEYEMTGTGASRIHALAATSGTIIAKGQVMTATLTDLPDGEYTFKAFVQTSAGYTYGEPQTFVIDYAGVGDITVDKVEPEIVGYYDINGRSYSAPQPGFNIVVYSDGSTKKLMVN